MFVLLRTILKINLEIKNNKVNYNIQCSIIPCIGKPKNFKEYVVLATLKNGNSQGQQKHSLNKKYELFSTYSHFKKMYFKTYGINHCLI